MIEMTGTPKDLLDCNTRIGSALEQIKNMLITTMVSQKQMYIALQEMKKDPGFNDKYNVQIKKIGDIFAQEDEE